MKLKKIIHLVLLVILATSSIYLLKVNKDLKSILNKYNPPVTNTGGNESSLTEQVAINDSIEKIKTPFLFPIHQEDYVKVSSFFGYRISPVLSIEKHHDGLDIQTIAGAQVVAVANGFVEQNWPPPKSRINGVIYNGHPIYGGLLIINHRNGFRTLYAHLSYTYVGGGQEVNAGDVIGRVGNTGVSKGEHLHFEVLSSSNDLNDIIKDAIRYNPLLYVNLPE